MQQSYSATMWMTVKKLALKYVPSSAGNVKECKERIKVILLNCYRNSIQVK